MIVDRHLALRWVVWLRYGLIAGEIVLIAGLSFGFQIAMPLVLIGPALAIQAISNWMLGLEKGRLGSHFEHIVGGLFILDALCLTLILALSGGPANPFSLLYLVQITFSAVVLREWWTRSLGIVSTLCFGLLFLVSRDVPVFHQHSEAGAFSVHLLGMWLAFAIAALLISFVVGRLSAEIHQMQRRLARNERLASLVTLAAGAAHEIATPLSTIAVTAKEMEHDAAVRLADQRVEEDARLIRSQVERCRLILERMGAQGADPFGEAPRTIGLEQLLLQVRENFAEDGPRIRIEADAKAGADCVIPVRAAVEALSALVKNALDASPNGDAVQLRAMRIAPESVRFLVRDEGVGMSPATIERVAEPFFTTKPAGKGMGLGAFLAHLFAQTLGGSLSFESEPGRGCTAILELPDTTHARS